MDVVNAVKMKVATLQVIENPASFLCILDSRLQDEDCRTQCLLHCCILEFLLSVYISGKEREQRSFSLLGREPASHPAVRRAHLLGGLKPCTHFKNDYNAPYGAERTNNVKRKTLQLPHNR